MVSENGNKKETKILVETNFRSFVFYFAIQKCCFWLYSLPLDINKLVNGPTSLNNPKTKGDDLDVGKLKNVPIGLKNVSDVVNNEVAKSTKFNTLKKKGNSWCNYFNLH